MSAPEYGIAVAEANQALNALRDRQEYNPDHDYD